MNRQEKCILELLILFLTLISRFHSCQGQETDNETKFIRSMVRGPGYEYPRHSFPLTKFDGTFSRWVVVGGRRIIPGSVYRVAVQAIRAEPVGNALPLTIRAALTQDDQQIAVGKIQIHPGELSNILLKVPDTSVQGKWELRVEGLEGTGQLPSFKNTTVLLFSPNFLTILIQTSRPVYNAGQTVRFRAVMLTRELRPYEEPVDIHVLDPNGRSMRRWPSRPTGDGVINLSFDLPEYPLLGNWTIKVQARQQVQNKTIIVEHYFRPRFEVFVRLPQSFKSTDSSISGVVVANMTNWRDVYGNCSIKLQIATNNHHPIPTKFETVYSEFIIPFKGAHRFDLPMGALAKRAGTLDNVVIRVLASVGDAFVWRIHDGWALSRIVQEKVKVMFLGDRPLFFRPGMPVTVHAFVSYEDNHPLGEEELEQSRMIITFKPSKRDPVIISGLDLAENEGVAMVTEITPDNSDTIEIVANFVSGSGLTSSARIEAIPYHSPREQYVQVETSTQDAVPGENIVLHVRCNFFASHINYVVMANGLLLYNDREEINDLGYPSITTFSLPASAQMSPVAKILVWVVSQHFEIVSDSIAVPVTPLGKHEVGVRWNEHKDHSGGSAEVKMLGETASFFATSAVWEETHMMDAGNDLSASRVLNHMMGFHDSGLQLTEEIIPHIRRAATRSRDGHGSQVRFLATSTGGPDAPSTFNFSEVFLLTNAMVYYHPSKASDAPGCEEGEMICLNGGCFKRHERCDGEPQCADFSDEAGCPVNIDPLRNFRIYRISRLYRLYDPIDGDWAWRDTRGVGSEIQVYPIPKRPQNWVFTMFGVGPNSGLGIMEENIQFDSAGPFMLTVEGPPVARMWEQVGLTVGVFNFHYSLVGVLVTLAYSDDYKTILVEKNGVVSSYNPRSVEGVFQHIVWLDPGESYDVHIPIVFKRMGTVEVTVEGSTQMQMDSQTIEIEVVAEGAGLGQHSSIILDLKNRALVYEFLDIHLDETPVIPYSLQRRYIFGTPSGSISVSGDIVGPAFPEIPVSEDNLIGFSSIGAETSAFNFGANMWMLHYLRLTNQITDEITYKVLNAVNVDYAALVRFQNEHGGFSNWIGSEPSVWLTAHALKNLWVANFQDWENYIYVDGDIIGRSVSWLLQYQTDYGSFQETEYYIHPLEPKVDPRSRHSWMPKYQNISLTAHVVISLQTVLLGLEGNLHVRANLAKQRAVRYLESVVHTLTDPYDLVVVTWALMKADSKEKEFAFNALDGMKRVNGDRIYWSREPVTFSTLIFEDSQRPYLQPKSDNRWDAHAVETTAYALLVYIKNDGIGLVQENIVRFLNSMREMDGGVISSMDSLVTLEALVEYSYRARIRDITNMHIEMEQSASPNVTFDLDLNSNENLAELRTFDLNGIFGHISIVGRGSGQALVQLSYDYGVDVADELDVAPVPSFDFKLHARFTGRNNSYITITSCQRWINVNETETSGLTVVDIHLPSGYYIMQDELIEMVNQRKIRNLRWAQRTDSFVKFFFNRLDNKQVCFTYRLERWYPVSNHSRYNMATIYELYQPERLYQVLFEVYPLYSLDICEVCGSYQCPYCPYYSYSPEIVPSVALITIISLPYLTWLFKIL